MKNDPLEKLFGLEVLAIKCEPILGEDLMGPIIDSVYALTEKDTTCSIKSLRALTAHREAMDSTYKKCLKSFKGLIPVICDLYKEALTDIEYITDMIYAHPLYENVYDLPEYIPVDIAKCLDPIDALSILESHIAQLRCIYVMLDLKAAE